MLLFWMWMFGVILLDDNVTGDESSSLQTLYDQYYQFRMKNSPEKATFQNIHDYDDKLSQFGLGQMDFTKAKTDEFLKRLRQINYQSLSKKEQTNYAVLNDTLTTVSDAYQWRLFGGLNPINFMEGNQVDPEFVVKTTPFKTKKDFENYLSRVNGAPQQIHDQMALMTEAIKLGRTNNALSMVRVPKELDDMIKDDPTDFVFYRPFKADLDKLQQISVTETADLRSQGKKASARYIEALRNLKQFIQQEYMVHARGAYGVGGLNQGSAYYIQCLKWHTTSDIPPEQVHEIGLKEVNRISIKMKQIMKRQNFTGTIAEYFTMLSKDPRFHFKTGDEIIARYTDLITNRFYPALPKYFKNIPSQKIKVTKMATDGPPAQYREGTSDGKRPGEFQANVYRPNETDSYTMVGYALHEAVPGHHFQISRQQTENLPTFRKEDTSGRRYSVPFSFQGYSAYIEGWALYAESLGEELGLYVDDYELMGRYSNEMFRACRLVVDTGIHYMGWTRYYSVNYFKQYSSLSGGNLENEIDRYITWPGQACSYKIGELKIRELRTRAENTLGSKFDIKEFHEVVLTAGPVPLSLLESIVDDWITQTQGSTSGHMDKPTESVQTHSGGNPEVTSGIHSGTQNPQSTIIKPSHPSTQGPIFTFTGQLPLVPNIG